MRINSEDFPLEKIQVGAINCQLLAGSHALTIAQLVNLVKKLHRRGVPLQMIAANNSAATYGVQISIEKARITLT